MKRAFVEEIAETRGFVVGFDVKVQHSIFIFLSRNFPLKTSDAPQSFWSQVCIYSECNSMQRLASGQSHSVLVTKMLRW